MNKREIQIGEDEKTINDIAEKLKLISNNNMVTKEKLSHKFDANYVVKNKMINFADQMLIEYENEIDNSKQINKRNED